MDDLTQQTLEQHQSLTLTDVVINPDKLDNINQLSEREAMGIQGPNSVSTLDDLTSCMHALQSLSLAELTVVLESLTAETCQRYAAGQLLALFGDERIDTLNPYMLPVPGAKVTLGLAETDVDNIVQTYYQYGVLAEWIEKETPEYTLEIPTFHLAKYCVTHKEYHEYLLDTGSEDFPEGWQFGIYRPELSNHPVNTVSAEQADNYAAWLSEKTGRHFRLPTEAEWEYAASGLRGLEFPWGNSFEPDHCNTVESGILRSTPVGMFPKGAGPFGHMDMAGNVEEYVSDNYKPYPGAEVIRDDLLEKVGDYRIARGGSFTRFRDLARTRRRHGRYESSLYVMGFRLAETV